MLEVRDLSVQYGPVTALQRVSIDVREGEIVAVVGANGAGKSSLMRAISGLAPASGGTFSLEGRPLLRQDPAAIVQRGVVHCPEGRGLFARLTIAENLQMGASRRKMSNIELRREMDALSEIFPILRERREQRAGTLSGGEQQMVALARAMIAKPTVLLLDEPALGLAPQIVRQVFAILPKMMSETKGMLIAEQQVEAALAIADRAYVLARGQIIESGAAGAIDRNKLALS